MYSLLYILMHIKTWRSSIQQYKIPQCNALKFPVMNEPKKYPPQSVFFIYFSLFIFIFINNS